MSEATEALLLAEVQQLRSEVRSLLERTPDTRRTWVAPAEFAAMVGKTTRTLLTWQKAGIFSEGSTRRKGNRTEYHRTKAMADVERGQV